MGWLAGQIPDLPQTLSHRCDPSIKLGSIAQQSCREKAFKLKRFAAFISAGTKFA
jgi:hypothetical protein